MIKVQNVLFKNGVFPLMFLKYKRKTGDDFPVSVYDRRQTDETTKSEPEAGSWRGVGFAPSETKRKSGSL